MKTEETDFSALIKSGSKLHQNALFQVVNLILVSHLLQQFDGDLHRHNLPFLDVSRDELAIF